MEAERNGISCIRRVAVLQQDRWVVYLMDLGSRAHCEAFWRGEVPRGSLISE